METFTRQDKLLFFGITFATISALTFIILYVNPIWNLSLAYAFLISFVASSVITVGKFGYKKGLENYKGINMPLVSSIIWSILASMRWLKYYNKNNFDWIMASLFTFVAIISWVNYFKNSKKISD